MNQSRMCLSPECGRKAEVRGLCNACRSTASQEIKAGRTTDVELVALGVMLPKHSELRSPFRKAIEEARKVAE